MASTMKTLMEKARSVAQANKDACIRSIEVELQLAELREMAQKTQVEVAEALGIKQPTVAGMEKRGHNLKLSSLKRYVAATGGTLHLAVELPDGSQYSLSI